MTPFADRAAAGRALAAELQGQGLRDPVVLALPRGGVPVAIEVAEALAAPLDLLLVRKIGAPGHEELALGSVVSGDEADFILVLNEDVVNALSVSGAQVSAMAERELREIERRRALYMAGQPPIGVEGKTAILVDDGIATGASMKAAVAAVRKRRPRTIIVAVPVAPPDSVAELASLADQVVCLEQPECFIAVGRFYQDFHQLSDAEVAGLLRAQGRLQ